MAAEKTIPYLKKSDKVVLFDGECGLCSKWCQFIIKYDRNHKIKLASMQSDKGRSILEYLQLPTENFKSMMFLENNTIYKKSAAFLAIIKNLPYPIKILYLLKLIPNYFRDFVYDRIALNRLKFFTKDELDLLATTDHNKRYL